MNEDTHTAHDGTEPLSRTRARSYAPFAVADAAVRALSPFERVVFWVLTAFFVLSAFAVFVEANHATTTPVPVAGGAIREGLIGAPRFINPLLALSDTDRDLTMLLYAGLTRPSPDGTLVPDVAKRFTISEDGTEYRFVLRDDARFHDGTPLTADDVVFTIETAQDPAIRSPRRADWEGVVVEKISDREVRFVLPQPYAPFLENTTIGILPRHIWAHVAPQEFAFSTFNTQPVGAGPFALHRIAYNTSGIPTHYELRAFTDYTLGRPYIRRVMLHFFPNQDELLSALAAGTVTSVSALAPQVIATLDDAHLTLHRGAFPRVFAIFFNQNTNAAFTDPAVRRALDVLIDKDALVTEVLGGYGTVIDSPLPPNAAGATQDARELPAQTTQERQEAARTLLTDAGWEFDEALGGWNNGEALLTFTLTTANTPELKSAAAFAADAWSAAGIPVQVTIFDTGDLNQNVIRPRDYEALFFGQVVGRSLDLFAFWHSSQREDPGLNIALYTNAAVDALLEEARATADARARAERYEEFEAIIREEVPAVFVYAPEFLYVAPERLKGVRIGIVGTPSERFAFVHEWHIDTERVWHFFK